MDSIKKRVAAAIQERHRAGESVAELADDYLVSRSMVRRIVASAPITDAPCIEISETDLKKLPRLP
jgi:hypothetical protein